MKFLTRIIFTKQKLMGGLSVSLNPTTRCNLKCNYCVSSIFLGEAPIFKNELTAKQWLEILLNYKPKIKFVVISGGEPSIYKDIVPLVDGLTKNKIAVRILTNLTSRRLLGVDNNPYVRFYTTLHYGFVDLDKFLENLRLYKNKFLVSVNEFEGKPKMIKGSRMKILETLDNPDRVSKTPEGDDLTYCRLKKGVLFIPDGRIVVNAHERDLLADN